MDATSYQRRRRHLLHHLDDQMDMVDWMITEAAGVDRGGEGVRFGIRGKTAASRLCGRIEVGSGGARRALDPWAAREGRSGRGARVAEEGGRDRWTERPWRVLGSAAKTGEWK